MKQIEIKGHSFKLEYPDVWQLISIETSKQNLARDHYGSFASNLTVHSQYVRNLIDMTATFNILIPDLAKQLQLKSVSGAAVESILDLRAEDAGELLKVYLREVKPWLDKWLQTQHEVLSMIRQSEQEAAQEQKQEEEKKGK